MKQVQVTTSWDDGHKLDIKLAALLRRYDIAGTFYVSPADREFARKDLLSIRQIRRLAQDFEIGAHTLTHPRLHKLSLAEATDEIIGSKKKLEAITGKKITSFCYPGGAYTPRVKHIVRQAGFRYARTVERFWTTTERGAFDAPTTTHAYRHWSDAWRIARFARFRPWAFLRYLFHWDALAIAQFEAVREQGGVYHLWGHSWEVENNRDWARLERVLAHIAATKHVQFLTNAEIAKQYNPKPRILFAASYFAPHPGGLELYIQQVGQGLGRQYGWELYGVASHHSKRGWHVEDDFRVCYLAPAFTLSNTPFSISWIWKVRRVIRHLQPDIINAHMPVPGLADIAVLQSGKTPVVVTYHTGSMRSGGSVLDALLMLYESLALPWILRRASHIIASSEFVRHDFLKRFSAKAHVVTPGVDVKRFVPARSSGQGTILFVGNYSRAATFKGLPDLLLAASRIKPKPRVLVVGKSDITEHYKAQAKALGIDKRVRFLGVLRGKELADAYRSAQVFVLPSLTESFPMVIAEALSSGVPVIAYDTGGIKEMVHHGKTGYLVPRKDIDGLTQRLAELLQDSKMARQMGREGRQLALSRLDWPRKIRQTHTLFVKLLKDMI